MPTRLFGAVNSSSDVRLEHSTQAAENIALGSDALSLIPFSPAPSVSNNVAVGIGALETLSNSLLNDSNIAIGADALNLTTTASRNIAIGAAIPSLGALGPLSAAGTKNSNIAIGVAAGASVTTATGNILIGDSAGDAITTGGQNIIIGYNIDAGSNTENGQVAIGNLLFGNGATGTGSTISEGNVGIGTRTFPATGSRGLFFGDGTAPASMGSNTAGIYADDVGGTTQLFAINEAGTSFQLTATPTVSAPFEGLQAPGADFTIETGNFAIHGRRLTLASSERATLEGNAQLVICGASS